MKLTFDIIGALISLCGYVFYIVLLSRLWVMASDYVHQKQNRTETTSPQLAKNITIALLLILLVFSTMSNVVQKNKLTNELHQAKIQRNECEEHFNDVLWLVRFTNNKLLKGYKK